METVTDEAVYRELLADLRTIRCTIRVEPHITEIRSDGLQTIFGVKVTCGSEMSQAYYWTKHRGERTGPQWETAKQSWRHIYKYMKEYVVPTLFASGVQLVQEARYFGVTEDELNKQFAHSADIIERFRKYSEDLACFRIGVERERTNAFHSAFEQWGAQYAFDIQERLRGRAKGSIGSNTRLRFSPDEMKLLLGVLKDAQRLWRRARNVFVVNQDNPDWRDIVLTECLRVTPAVNMLDDDLIEAIAQRTDRGDFTYKPIQVAVVSAARHANFANKEDEFSPPSMTQYKMIERAVKEWRERFATTK